MATTGAACTLGLVRLRAADLFLARDGDFFARAFFLFGVLEGLADRFLAGFDFFTAIPPPLLPPPR